MRAEAGGAAAHDVLVISLSSLPLNTISSGPRQAQLDLGIVPSDSDAGGCSPGWKLSALGGCSPGWKPWKASVRGDADSVVSSAARLG